MDADSNEETFGFLYDEWVGNTGITDPCGWIHVKNLISEPQQVLHFVWKDRQEVFLFYSSSPCRILKIGIKAGSIFFESLKSSRQHLRRVTK